MTGIVCAMVGNSYAPPTIDVEYFVLAGGGGGKGATAANKKALARLEADAAKLGDLVDQLMGVQKVDPFGYGTFRMGEAKSLQQYNITVNGAIDSESTARQIVEILNDSSARGTLGAGAFDR